MAKEIKNPVEVKFVFTEEDDGIHVAPSVHYGRTCEYGDLPRIGMDIVLTPTQEQFIKQQIALAVVLPQMLTNEEIA